MASTTLKGNTQTSVSEPLFGPASIDEAIKRVENAEKLTGATLEDFVAELKTNNYGKPHSACATIKTQGCDWKIPIIGWQIGWQITRF